MSRMLGTEMPKTDGGACGSSAAEGGVCRRLLRSDRLRGALLRAAVLVLVSGVAVAAGGEHKSEAEIMKEVIFQAINLLILLGVLFYFGRRPIAEHFATRREGIQDELKHAAELLDKAEQRNSELQRRLIDLSSEVEEIRETSNRRAEAEAERILADARSVADRIRRDAQAAVAQELRRAQSELQKEAAELALELAGQKLSEQIQPSDRERLVDEFITRVEPNPSQTESSPGQGVSR